MMIHKALPILCVGVLMMGLGGASPVAAQGGDKSDQALIYAQCVRDHGYTDFPDPQADGFQFLIDPPNLQRFRKAVDACRDLAPEGMRDRDITPDELDEFMKLAQCMRENGTPGFPDPDPAGHFDLRDAGVAPDEPRFKTAMTSCSNEIGLSRAAIVVGG